VDTSQYAEVFLDESREHLQAVNDQLLNLEKQPNDLNIVGEMFRSAHTLKGMAATMGFEDIASLTHQMENALDSIRNQKIDASTEVIDIIFSCLESLEEMVESISAGRDGKKDVSSLVRQLESIEKGENVVPGQSDGEKTQESPNMNMEVDEYQLAVLSQSKEQGYTPIQLTVQLNEDVMLKSVRSFMVFEALENVGEVIKTIPSAEEIEEEQFDTTFSVLLLTKEDMSDVKKAVMSVSEISDVHTEAFNQKQQEQEDKQAQDKGNQNSKTETAESQSETQTDSTKTKQPASKSIRVNIDRIDHLMNLFEEVVIDRGRLEDISKKIDNNELSDTVEHITRVSQEMQSMMLSMRMVPIEQVFNRFPRMIRGLAKDLGKKIDLEITGEDTELDRTVIDEIGDPLVHFIRNSVDHGIEMPEDRTQKGKPPEGHLKLSAYQSGNHVFIEIADDGAGINRDKVVAKAIKNGVITEEQSKKLTDEEAFSLIFSSGFSTADSVTDVSGRGVGLDVVKNAVEALGGHITTESELDKGSKFTIQLPLTLSILSTLLVKVQKETYAIPLSSIEETLVLKKEDIMYVNKKPVLEFRDQVVPLVSLQEQFNLPQVHNHSGDEDKPIVIVKKGDKTTGLVIDSFIGQKEVVLKSLGKYFTDVHGISGATILGDGSISLILDPNAFIK